MLRWNDPRLNENVLTFLNAFISDGMFDNVHQAEIVQLARFIREKHHAQWIARSSPSSPSSSSPSQSPSNGGESADAQAPSLDMQDSLAEERDFVNVLAHKYVG